MDGIVHGRVFGANRIELVTSARAIAATYFSARPADIRVELDDEKFAPRQGAGEDNREPRFAANFRAEVIS